MPLNVGYIELGGGGITVRVYYDTAFLPVGVDQPLIDGPRGYCLDVTNTTGKQRTLTITGLAANPLKVAIDQGDPVLTGAGRSRTKLQLAANGFTTRGDVGTISLE